LPALTTVEAVRITGRRDLAARFAALVLALMSSQVLTACAAPGAGGRARPTVTSPPPSWAIAAPSQVTAIRQSGDQTRLTIDLTMPAALGDHECWRNLAGGVDDFSEKSTLIQVTAEMWSDPRCGHSTTTESVAVDLPAPLGARTVNVNNSTLGGYIADPVGSPTLRYCYGFRCGPPHPATCDGSSVHDAAAGTEVDPHARYTLRGCDGHWLVLDFTWTGGPACDNACPTMGGSTARWFYRGTNQGWQAIVSTTAAGCAPVLAVEPAFPTALCDGLDPLR
jgi:hypothetical protein